MSHPLFRCSSNHVRKILVSAPRKYGSYVGVPAYTKALPFSSHEVSSVALILTRAYFNTDSVEYFLVYTHLGFRGFFQFALRFYRWKKARATQARPADCNVWRARHHARPAVFLPPVNLKLSCISLLFFRVLYGFLGDVGPCSCWFVRCVWVGIETGSVGGCTHAVWKSREE